MDVNFFIKNRKKVWKSLEKNSIAIFFSGQEIRKSADVYYPFFANRNYYYLTGLEEPNAILVIEKFEDDLCKECLFVEAIDAVSERWFGKRMTQDEITDYSGIDCFNLESEFEKWLYNRIKYGNVENLYFDLYKAKTTELDNLSYEYCHKCVKVFPYVKINNIRKIMMKIRTIKEDCEINAMRYAIDITKKAFLRMMDVACPGMYEYQLKAEFDYIIAQNGLKDASFTPIITTGDNNFCIHYSSYKDMIKENDLILCDAGVIYDGLCCDVSRVWPAKGWFTEKQQKYYRCIIEISDYLFSVIKPGMYMREIYRLQRRITREKIYEYGISCSLNDSDKYIWHGGAHHIGFDNHDEVDIEVNAQQPIEENMVFAIDIGIYDLENNIGFRIEDDCLITKNGCENLTKSIPRTLDEVKFYLKR